MAINLTDPVFTDENKAREHLEAIRWPDGPTCPHCGSVDKVYRLNGKSHRPGLIHCNACDGSFTVTTGSVMESSHVPLNKWVLAYRLMAGSKKGISAHQLHRTIGVTYKTAWFMAHRIRESMETNVASPLGGGGKVVEADETYILRKKGMRKKRGFAHTMKVMSLVERGGPVRSMVLDTVTNKEVGDIIRKNVRRDSKLMTDSAAYYKSGVLSVAKHEMVNHNADEYVRGEAHVNTLEGYFSIFKKGMRGIYQHVGEQHLHRYLAEFDFRYNNRIAMGVNDSERATRAIKGAEGKRLTYKQSSSAQ